MFLTEEAYNAALLKNKQSLGGRYLDVQVAAGAKTQSSDPRATAEAMPADCTTLFVKNLPYTFKEDDIGDRFRRFGEITAIRIAYNWTTKQSKGFAYVTFSEHDAAKKALLKLDGKEIEGRNIKVDYDVGKAKQSYHVNTDDSKGNKFYNKEPIKEIKLKRQRKENEKHKLAKIKKHH